MRYNYDIGDPSRVAFVFEWCHKHPKNAITTARPFCPDCRKEQQIRIHLFGQINPSRQPHQVYTQLQAPLPLEPPPGYDEEDR